MRRLAGRTPAPTPARRTALDWERRLPGAACGIRTRDLRITRAPRKCSARSMSTDSTPLGSQGTTRAGAGAVSATVGDATAGHAVRAQPEARKWRAIPRRHRSATP